MNENRSIEEKIKKIGEKLKKMVDSSKSPVVFLFGGPKGVFKTTNAKKVSKLIGLRFYEYGHTLRKNKEEGTEYYEIISKNGAEPSKNKHRQTFPIKVVMEMLSTKFGESTDNILQGGKGAVFDGLAKTIVHLEETLKYFSNYPKKPIIIGIMFGKFEFDDEHYEKSEVKKRLVERCEKRKKDDVLRKDEDDEVVGFYFENYVNQGASMREMICDSGGKYCLIDTTPKERKREDVLLEVLEKLCGCLEQEARKYCHISFSSPFLFCNKNIKRYLSINMHDIC